MYSTELGDTGAMRGETHLGVGSNGDRTGVFEIYSKLLSLVEISKFTRSGRTSSNHFQKRGKFSILRPNSASSF